MLLSLNKGNIEGWTYDVYMPRLKTIYNLDLDKVPFDFDGVVAALAPRAFFSNSPLYDTNMTFAGVKESLPGIRKIYSLFNVLDELQFCHPECGHDFPEFVRRQAYGFIDKVLDYPSSRC